MKSRKIWGAQGIAIVAGCGIAMAWQMSCSTPTKKFEDRGIYRIDQKCLKESIDPVKLEAQIKKGFEQGMACLKGLKKEGREQTYEPLKKILDFWDYVEIECPDDLSDDTMANSQLQMYQSGRQPVIRLNSKNINQAIKRGDDIAGTTLHELLHMPGHAHYTSIDYSYACEFYCFPPKNVSLEYHRKTVEKMASEICGGKYSDADNFDYLREINNVQFIFHKNLSQSVERIHFAILRHPRNRALQLMLARYLIEYPVWFVGMMLWDSLESIWVFEGPTPKEKEWMSYLKIQKVKRKIPNEYLEPARLISKAFILTYDGKSSESREILKNLVLPTQVKSVKRSTVDAINSDFEVLVRVLKMDEHK